MNPSNQPGQSSQLIQPVHGKWRQRKGVALILVVSFVVLLSALVVGFFSRVQTDLAGTRSYAEGVNVRQLAESAVSMVMGQIRAATTITNGCWASQPGMIRVYGGNGGAAGSQAYRFYKLYSSHNMVVTNFSAFDPTNTSPSGGSNVEVPIGTGGWQNQPAYFTDLNEPANVPNPGVTGQTLKRYPIFDPSVASIPALGQNPTNGVEGAVVNITDLPTLQINQAPMPVRWVYVLRDGTLTAPTPLSSPASGTTGLQASFSGAGTASSPSQGIPTQANPIVGRIAFWADDDTCKVNINTAGGYIANDTLTPNYTYSTMYHGGPQMDTNPAFFPGSYWDTPRVQTYFDMGINGAPGVFRGGLATAQPVRNEFQRYPGHPSTTSLGLVLNGLLAGQASSLGLNSERLYNLTPRLMAGAALPGEVLKPAGSVTKNSQGGSMQLITYGMSLDPSFYGTGGAPADPPSTTKTTYNPLKSYNASDPTTWSWHLYSSVDELYYTTLNSPNIKASNGGRTSAADGSASNNEMGLNSAITPSLVDKSRFFLTAHSRSPELNLFGRPRVGIWPVPNANSTNEIRLSGLGLRNPSDDLLRFCSSIGVKGVVNPLDPNRQGQFDFDRDDPYSPTADFARTGNQQVFQYLESVTSNGTGRIPGWGTSFEGKYSVAPGGRDQILTEIFDYIRTVNLKDTSRDQQIDAIYGRTNPYTQPAVAAAEILKTYTRYAPRGIVVPTKSKSPIGNTVSGFGRFPTVSEISLVFYHAGYLYKPRATFSTAAEQVEYNYQNVDERNYNTVGTAKTWQGTSATTGNVLTGKLIRAFIVIETFNPMQGYGPVTDYNTGLKERFVHEITNLSGFSIKSPSSPQTSLKMGTGQNNIWQSSGSTWAGRNFGGTEGFFHTLQGKVNNTPPVNIMAPPYPWTYGKSTYAAAGSIGVQNLPPGTNTVGNAYYPFQTPCLNPTDGVRIPINIPPTTPPGTIPTPAQEDSTFTFSGGTFTLNIRYMDAAHTNTNAQLIQTMTVNFPGSTTPWPLPITEREAKARGQGYRYQSELWQTTTNADQNLDYGGFNTYVAGKRSPINGNQGDWPGNQLGWSEWGGYRMPYNLPLRIAWAQQQSYAPWWALNSTVYNASGVQVTTGLDYQNRFLQILQPGDTIRSLIPGGNGATVVPEASDPRTIMLQTTVPATSFGPHPDYQTAKRRAQTLRRGDGGFYFDPAMPLINSDDPLVSTAQNTLTGSLVPLGGNTRYINGYGPDLPRSTTALRSGGGYADFDTGIGNFPDGAFCGKADEGSVSRGWLDTTTHIYHYVQPYFSTWTYDAPGDTYFSPNRQIPSPVMFGSLLAPWRNNWNQNGWKTLLFCPNPAGGNHPGANSPPDHLLLDLFNMPVVEPYAISEPFSTDGKVNLNFQLMPFGYIERSTALRAALQPLRITAIPNTFTRQNGASSELAYKGVTNDANLRYLVDRDETIKAFRWNYSQYGPGIPNGGFFKSASQICEMFLYPKGQPLSGQKATRSTVTFTPGDSNAKVWWNNNTVTGDNVREKPYSDLYSRVTTKSNTYTVHYRVQSLRQRPYTGAASGAAAYYQTWDESRDQVLSEYRGNTTIERYLDPQDPRFFATGANSINPYTQSLETAYRFRVIYNKRFAPW
jgi:hypothetical protein